MAFTFDLTTNLGLIRLELGDDVSGAGVRPDGTNLSDEALQALLTREGAVMRAAAAACELLARQWATTANISLGPRSEQLGQVSETWAKRGADLRAQYGGGSFAFAAAMARDDGYADNDTEYSA